MFRLNVRDHIMIAHSLDDMAFGKAQRVHGATFVVDAEFSTAELNKQQVVIDIGLASKTLRKTLDHIDYANLDEIPEFGGDFTTTEFLAKWIHGALSKRLAEIFSGSLKITLHESHIAWASYESKI